MAKVQVFTDADCRAEATDSTAGQYSDLPLRNDQISLMTIPAGWEVIAGASLVIDEGATAPAFHADRDFRGSQFRVRDPWVQVAHDQGAGGVVSARPRRAEERPIDMGRSLRTSVDGPGWLGRPPRAHRQAGLVAPLRRRHALDRRRRQPPGLGHRGLSARQLVSGP